MERKQVNFGLFFGGFMDSKDVESRIGISIDEGRDKEWMKSYL